MASVDDQATAHEELDRQLCLSRRRPVGPPPCGACYNCGEKLEGDLRFCPGGECRDDWALREKLGSQR